VRYERRNIFTALARAVVAATLQGAEQGDTKTLDETLSEAGMAVAEQVEREVELRPQEKPKVNGLGSKKRLPTRSITVAR